MSAQSFTKLFSSLTESTLWVEQPNHVRIVWITMLAMADRDGMVAASIPGLARRACVTVTETEEALKVFLSPDKYSRTPDFEGRRIREVMGGWVLLNYVTYRKLQSEEFERSRKREWARANRSVDVVPSGLQLTELAEVDECRQSSSASSSTSLSRSDLDPDPERAGEVEASAESAPVEPTRPVTLDDPCPHPARSHHGLHEVYLDPRAPDSAQCRACGAKPAPGAHVEAQGARTVWRNLDGWQPTDELYAEAKLQGVTREVFDAQLAKLRNGPIGGVRGVFDRDDYVRQQIPKWRTWAETDRAKASASSQVTRSRAFGQGLTPPLVASAKHVAFAKRYGIELDPIVNGLVLEGVVDSLGLGRAKELIGERLLAAKRKAAS